jgi:hypothetical protein
MNDSGLSPVLEMKMGYSITWLNQLGATVSGSQYQTKRLSVIQGANCMRV